MDTIVTSQNISSLSFGIFISPPQYGVITFDPKTGNCVDSPVSIYDEKIREIYRVFDELKFSNKLVLTLAETLLIKAFEEEKYHIQITQGGDEQLVLFSEKKSDCFSNLAIDEDGDVSYMYFDKDKTKSKRKLYYFEDGIDFEELVSLL